MPTGPRGVFRPGTVKDPALPHVLLIGDSILNNYSTFVISGLKTKATVDLWVNPLNQASKTLKSELSQVLKNGPFAVIHFNMGLHGWQKDRIPADQFESLTTDLVKMIRAQAPQATLIWASTTPISVKGTPTTLDPEANPIIIAHNAMAAKVMQAEKVEIDDLYTAMIDHLDMMSGDQFHWRGTGQKLQATFVTTCIERALATRK